MSCNFREGTCDRSPTRRIRRIQAEGYSTDVCLFWVGGGCRSENEAVAEGLAHGFGFGVDVQLIVNAADVIADGVDADVQLFGGAAVPVALQRRA